MQRFHSLATGGNGHCWASQRSRDEEFPRDPAVASSAIENREPAANPPEVAPGSHSPMATGNVEAERVASLFAGPDGAGSEGVVDQGKPL